MADVGACIGSGQPKSAINKLCCGYTKNQSTCVFFNALIDQSNNLGRILENRAPVLGRVLQIHLGAGGSRYLLLFGSLLVKSLK